MIRFQFRSMLDHHLPTRLVATIMTATSEILRMARRAVLLAAMMTMLKLYLMLCSVVQLMQPSE